MSDIIEEITAKLEQYEKAGVGRYYRPLSEAADEFIRFAQTPEKRVKIGIPQFDDVIRGVAPGELCLINGFAHSGKTVLATEILLANKKNPIVLFTPDETRPAVLTKLAAATTGVGAEELERRIYKQDETARQLLIDVASEYQHLAVYDENVTLHQMDVMLEEAQNAFNDPIKAVVFDYAEQLNEAIDTKAKLDALKRWGKDQNVALIVLHQTSRTAGAGGKQLGIDSGSYGGEQQATFLLVVRRKINFFRDRLVELEYKLANSSNPQAQQRYTDQIAEIISVEIPRHMDTVSVGLVKNKRPPMTLVDEIDFTIDKDTGRLFYTGKSESIPIQNDLNIKGHSARELLNTNKGE